MPACFPTISNKYQLGQGEYWMWAVRNTRWWKLISHNGNHHIYQNHISWYNPGFNLIIVNVAIYETNLQSTQKPNLSKHLCDLDSDSECWRLPPVHLIRRSLTILSASKQWCYRHLQLASRRKMSVEGDFLQTMSCQMWWLYLQRAFSLTITPLSESRISNLSRRHLIQVRIHPHQIGACSCKPSEVLVKFHFGRESSFRKSLFAIARKNSIFSPFSIHSWRMKISENQRRMTGKGNEICGKLLHQTIK